MVRTLILEDNLTDLLLFEAALSDCGYKGELLKTTTAQSFMEKFSLMCESSKPEDLNIIFLDILLNKSDGIQVLKIINSQLLYGQMVVYCFSGLISEQTIQSSYSLGINAYLFKPGNYPDMVELIDKAMEFAIRQKKHKEVGMNRTNRAGLFSKVPYQQTLTDRNKNRRPFI